LYNYSHAAPLSSVGVPAIFIFVLVIARAGKLGPIRGKSTGYRR
jgi:hypothetical protein